MDKDLPDKNIQALSLDLYFAHIHPWCPILHQKSLREKFNFSRITSEDFILLHAIIAVTMRFFPRDKIDLKQHEKSKNIVVLYGMDHCSVTVLQALVVLALDILGTQHGHAALSILAVITRSVEQLELATESTDVPELTRENSISVYTVRGVTLPQPENWIERECRRRLFWMVYILDRLTTVVTSFRFSLDETETARRLPCDGTLFENGNFKMYDYQVKRWFQVRQTDKRLLQDNRHMDAFSFYVDAVHLLSLIHQFLREPVNIDTSAERREWWSKHCGLDDYLSEWLHSVPANYGLPGRRSASGPGFEGNLIENDYGQVMLHATYHT